jgi:VanZ family protein
MRINYLDKFLHFLEYGILGILVVRAYKRIKLSLLGCCIYALLEELHQAFVPTRSVEFIDFIADVIGIFIFSLIYYYKFLLPIKAKKE